MNAEWEAFVSYLNALWLETWQGNVLTIRNIKCFSLIVIYFFFPIIFCFHIGSEIQWPIKRNGDHVDYKIQNSVHQTLSANYLHIIGDNSNYQAEKPKVLSCDTIYRKKGNIPPAISTLLISLNHFHHGKVKILCYYLNIYLCVDFPSSVLQFTELKTPYLALPYSTHPKIQSRNVIVTGMFLISF